jgi:hypothetical protein
MTRQIRLIRTIVFEGDEEVINAALVRALLDPETRPIYRTPKLVISERARQIETLDMAKEGSDEG